jgi:hypothetical protein
VIAHHFRVHLTLTLNDNNVGGGQEKVATAKSGLAGEVTKTLPTWVAVAISGPGKSKVE